MRPSTDKHGKARETSTFNESPEDTRYARARQALDGCREQESYARQLLAQAIRDTARAKDRCEAAFAAAEHAAIRRINTQNKGNHTP